MQRVVPALRITEEARSRAFYVDALGFRVDWEWRHEPELPVFMQITRGSLTLYLTQHEGDCQVGGLAYLYVPDVDTWYVEVRGQGLDAEPPVTHPWGNREMVLVDPDGNRLVVATPRPG